MPISALRAVRNLVNPEMFVPVSERLSALFNQILTTDEKTKFRLHELGNCSIGFVLRETSLRIILEVHDGQVRVIRDQALIPDVQIEGSASDFVAMARSQREGSPMAAGKVSIQGDLATAQNVQTIIAEANIDLEDIASQYVGDIPARQIGRTVRGGFKWIKNSQRTLERDITEFLQFESRVLTTEREIENFIRSCSTIESDVDRLQARIERIQRKRVQK